MKKLKIAGYQGDGSVHTRSVKFFINKVANYFNISFDQDITCLLYTSDAADE